MTSMFSGCRCDYPRYTHFQDTNGGRITAVIYCEKCQRICSEIFIEVPAMPNAPDGWYFDY